MCQCSHGLLATLCASTDIQKHFTHHSISCVVPAIIQTVSTRHTLQIVTLNDRLVLKSLEMYKPYYFL